MAVWLADSDGFLMGFPSRAVLTQKRDKSIVLDGKDEKAVDVNTEVDFHMLIIKK